MSESLSFAADWLSLREPVDHRSRAAPLDHELQAWLSSMTDAPSPLRILDLGSGAGSNLRYLAPRLPQRQHWTLVDHDPALLERARQSSSRLLTGNAETRCADLSRLEALELPRPDLVTASAWLDLVTASWIEAFGRQIERWSVPVLIVLSVDGRRGFLDRAGERQALASDEAMREAFNRHQRQVKGLDAEPALGPEACAALADRLTRTFDVETRRSDWRLPAGSDEARSLGLELLGGWARAAGEAESAAARPAVEAWHHERRDQLSRGELGLHVGHLDLLALPR